MNLVETESQSRRSVGEKFCWYQVAIPCAVFFLTLLAFLPSLQNGFVDWDDDVNFLNNPDYRGLSLRHLRWMFETFHYYNYRPLTWMTFGLDYILWGLNPFGYHLTSLLLHGINALLVYFIARRLLSLARSIRAMPNDISVSIAAAFSALIFSIHPLRVEPVVWASARNHVLSSLFFLSTILYYLRVTADETGTRWVRWRGLSVAALLFTLSLLAQPSGITLPFVLLILDIYPLRRLGGGPGKWFGHEARRIWWEKLPFFLLALLAAITGILVKQVVSFLQLGLARRVVLAPYALLFYTWKTVFPTNLSPIYQVPLAHFDIWDWPFLVSEFLAIAITIGLFAVRRRYPAGLAGWTYYVLNLAPYLAIMAVVLGSAQNDPQVAADRYSYLSCLPYAVLAGFGMLYGWRLWMTRQIGVRTGIFGSLAVGFTVVALMALTWRQSQIWHDSDTLWRYAVTATDKSYFGSMGAHYNLANELRKEGKLDEAANHYRQSLALNARYPETHNNLALVLAQKNDLAGAREHFQEAIKLNPQYSEARANLGNVLAMQGDSTGAIREYREALKVSPNLDGAHLQVAMLLAKLNQLGEAKSEFQEYLKKRPDSVEAHYFLGTIYLAQRDFQKGMDEMNTVLKLRPDSADAHITLARVLRVQGKLDEASKHYKQALAILNAQRELQNLR